MCPAQDGDVLATGDTSPKVATGSKQFVRLTIGLAAAVVLLDQITKKLVQDNLRPESCAVPDACIDVVWTLRIHFVENPGMAFSRGESIGPVLGVVAAIMALVLARAAWRSPSAWAQAMFGLIIGGAIGNLIDRIVRAEDGFLSGSVVDFVDLQWWPVWNIADAAIVLGVIGLIGASWLRPEILTPRGPDEVGPSTTSEAPAS